MSERYTQKDARQAFLHLCALMNKNVTLYDRAIKDSQIGTWTLDCNTTYGGYVVEEICNDAFGVRRPFGDYRVSAREFSFMVNRIADTISILRKDGRLKE